MQKFEIFEASYGTTYYFTIIQAPYTTTITLNNGNYHMQKGDIILCREGIQWSVKNGNLYVINCTSFAFDTLFYSQIAECRIIHDFFNDTSHKHEHLFFSASKDRTSLIMMDQILHESSLNDEHHTKMMHLLLVGLLTSLDRSRHTTLIVSNSTMVSQNRFGKIMNYIGEHYTECSLQDVAQQFGYHPDYLSKRFKMITGVTFKQKLLEIRLEKAEELLISSDFTIEQISQVVGFHDKSWFQKKFKEKYSYTPATYRKIHK